ncbi:MAG: glycosyltransferase [Olleya sp.]
MATKIVHVIDVFPSKSETFIVNYIYATLQYGYSAQLLVNTLGSIEKSSQQDLLKKTGLFKSAKTYNSKLPKNKIKRLLLATSVLILNYKDALVFFRTLNFKKYGLKSKTLKMWFQAAVFLEYKDVSHFHAHFGLNGKLLSEMKEIGAIKGKIITSFYGYDTYSTTETNHYFRHYYSDTFKNSSHIVTSSNYLLNNLLKLNVPLEKVMVNPVGVDLEIFKFKKRNYDGILNIITVGRLIKLKGQHIGIDVIKVLTDKGYKIKYTIVGGGEEYEALVQKITKLKLQDSIVLVGVSSQTEILKLLHRHHLFLMTSVIDEKGRAEAQGLVSAEAQATGLPIVGFGTGGIPETIINEKTGYIVNEGDVNAMAEAVEKFILDPKLAGVMGLKARSFIEEKFNNRIQSQNIMNLYN